MQFILKTRKIIRSIDFQIHVPVWRLQNLATLGPSIVIYYTRLTTIDFVSARLSSNPRSHCTNWSRAKAKLFSAAVARRFSSSSGDPAVPARGRDTNTIHARAISRSTPVHIQRGRLLLWLRRFVTGINMG